MQLVNRDANAVTTCNSLNLNQTKMHRNSLTLRWALLSLLFSCNFIFAQSHHHPIADEVARRQADLALQPEITLLTPQVPGAPWAEQVREKISDAAYFTLNHEMLHQVDRDRPATLKLRIQDHSGLPLLLELYKAEFLTPEFKLRKASNPEESIPFDPGIHYRGIVNGDDHSLAMLMVHEEEVSGIIEFRGQKYNLGKVEGTSGVHIIYPEDAMADPPTKGCFADDLPNYRPGNGHSGGTRSPNPNNCVKLYVEVDKDIHDGKGGVTQAANYVAGVFSQVSTLYANESINLVVNEIFVWDTNDPYSGPSTLDYLVQFRNQRNGNFNGADMGHLVGYQGGGGIAYLDVICNGNFSVAYSDINSTYNTVPTYSWTVSVVTHEIGHNLGSPHTHDCSWNGNNTPIDNCGPIAGYTPSGCFNNGQTPNAGTIMSYCHLVSGVGISFVENFGPQPGDLIRNEVYNASCLAPCSTVSTTDAGIAAILEPSGLVCGNSTQPVVTLSNFGSETLTSVAIDYNVDNGPTQTYNWSGNLGSGASVDVTLPAIAFGGGSHIISVSTDNPNGGADSTPSNDGATANFTRGDLFLTLSITFDNFPEETSWTITNSTNNVVASGGGYNNQPNGSTITEDICLTDGCYSFNIFDSDGDGICCSAGNGSYSLLEVASGTVLASGGNFSNSETTSFCLPACVAPTNINASQITASSTFLSWSAVGAAQNYRLQYLQQGAPMNQAVNLVVGSNGYQASGLLPNTTYLWRVRAQCDGENSPFSSVGNFTTLDDACPDSDNDGVCDGDDQCPGFDDTLIGTPCDDGDDCTENDIYGSDCNCTGTLIDTNNNNICDLDEGCTEPTNLNGFANSSTSATFQWDPVPNANNYRLQYRPIGFSPTSIIVNATSHVDNNLPSGSTVQWRVRAICDGPNSSFVVGPAVNLGSSMPMDSPSGNFFAEDLELIMFPNPARDQVTLSVNRPDMQSSIMVRNMMGQTLGRYVLQGNEQLILNTNDWGNNQVLLVTVYTEGETPVSQRLVISR